MLPEMNKKEGKKQEKNFICSINHDVNDAMNLQTTKKSMTFGVPLIVCVWMCWWMKIKDYTGRLIMEI